MNIDVLFFGQLTEIAGRSSLKFSDISDTEDLQRLLHNQFPAMTQMTYSIALNKQVIQQNNLLKDGDQVAFLPPFSGG